MLRIVVGLLVTVLAVARPGEAAAGETHLVLGHPLDFTVVGGAEFLEEHVDLVGSAYVPPLEGDENALPPYTADVSGFLVFKLPAPTAGELPIVRHARLSVHVEDVAGPPSFALDLYGLPTPREASELYLYNWEYDPRPDVYDDSSGDRAGTLIEAGLVHSGSPFPTWFSSTAEASLTAHLTTLYAEGGAGKYALFRLNPNVAPSELAYEVAGYLLNFAGFSALDDPFDFESLDSTNPSEFRPRLEIEFVPEPQIAAGAAAAVFLARRRNRHAVLS